MTTQSLATSPHEFNIGDIVWAQRNHDGMYWPGRITFVSNNSIDTLSTQINLPDQTCSYLIELFACNQTNWTPDVLSYRQYRDYMIKHLSVHYDSYPQMKYRFLNAINQADYANINSNPFRIKSDTCASSYSYSTNNSYVPTSEYMRTTYENSTSPNYSFDNLYQYPSNCICNSQLYCNNYCSYSTQSQYSTTNSLAIQINPNVTSPIINTYPQIQHDTLMTTIDSSHKQHSIIIITSKTYLNSSFISYIFNCFSNVFPTSIIYIEDLINYQHPNAYNIIYLISIDHFDSTIQYTFNSTILNNLSSYVNYLFLIINAPSYDLIKHFYSTIVDKQTILILQYRSTFDNDPLLLCSGNRTTFDKIQSSILKYLCSNIKYIESNDNQHEQYDHISMRSSQLNNVVEGSNQPWELSSLKTEQNFRNEYQSVSSVIKRKKSLNQRNVFDNFRKKLYKRKLKQKLSTNDTMFNIQSEYNVQNILQSANSSKDLTT